MKFEQEDDFANKLKKNELPKTSQVKATEKKQENILAGDAFALNFVSVIIFRYVTVISLEINSPVKMPKKMEK